MSTDKRWIIIALSVSVALNLALLGFMAGRMVEGRTMPPRMDPSLAFFPVLRDLPEQRQRELRPAVRESLRTARPAMRRMRSAQRDIQTALHQEPYAEAELAAALEAFRKALSSSQESSHTALLRLAAAMTPAERAQLAEAMRQGRRGSRPPDNPGERRW